jgi:hypothetical protein
VGSAGQFLFTFTEMVWELTLPIYAIRKGFRSTSIVSLDNPKPAIDASMATV